MSTFVIFGNSGAGKSTLARQLAALHTLAHLDLDTIAWLPCNLSEGESPKRMPLADSRRHIERFIEQHPKWVIEGCYADLIELVLPYTSKLVFLNLPIKACIENAKARPWEPHKYPSKAEQDANLPMLIKWIENYDYRTDTFSQRAHQQLFDQFSGSKAMHTTNQHE